MTIIKNEKNKGTLIALYSTLRKEGIVHFEIDNENVKYLGQYITKPIYTMYNMGDVFAGIILGGNTSITLEMFEVNSLVTEDIIDETLGYNILNIQESLFTKHVVDTPYGNAFIYYYNAKIRPQDRIVESGDWIYELSQFNKNTQREYEIIQTTIKVETSKSQLLTS